LPGVFRRRLRFGPRLFDELQDRLAAAVLDHFAEAEEHILGDLVAVSGDHAGKICLI